MRLYYDDPYLSAFKSRVIAEREDERGIWVELQDSAFYPESGGQLPDRGLLSGVPVEDVQAGRDGRV